MTRHADEARLAAALQSVYDLGLERAEKSARAVAWLVEKEWRDLFLSAATKRIRSVHVREPQIRQQVQTLLTSQLTSEVRQAYIGTWQAFVDRLPARYWGYLAELKRSKKPKKVAEAELEFGDGPEGDVEAALFRPMSPERVSAIVKSPVEGVTWEKRIAALSRRAMNFDAIAAELSKGIAEGKNPRAMVTSLMPFVDGYRAGAARIARTETLRVHNQARQETFESFKDVMAGQRIVETLDERTRPHHQERHGTIYVEPEYESQFPGARSMSEWFDLPDEPNCRGVWQPVLAPEDAILAQAATGGRRTVASIDGPVKDPGVYSSWYDKQSAARKRRIAGTKRWDTTKKILGRTPKWKDLFDPSTDRLRSIADLKAISKSDLLAQSSLVQADIDARLSALRVESPGLP